MDTTELKKLFEKQRDVEKELEGFNRVYEQIKSFEQQDGWNIEFSLPFKEEWEAVTIYNVNQNISLGIIKGFITSKNGELKQLNKRINNEINNIAKGEQDNG